MRQNVRTYIAAAASAAAAEPASLLVANLGAEFAI
jgi:hypothetical protein